MSAPADDAVLAELRRQVRYLVAELAGPVRRVRVRSGQTTLEVEWHGTGQPVPAPRTEPAVAPTEEPPDGSSTAVTPAAGQAVAAVVVRAPVVGTFYRCPEPGAAPFVAVGDLVRAGQVVGIVEAMKLMNEVVTDTAGRVVELVAADGQPVEYDQPLVAVAPA
ncbi:hypothetical protein GCM10012279_26210 [Micromonospora yangpuensis]|uniref:Biotin carboxyl carrier protein of acetyl-CoA carboxylase n=1 Tax=Micromonospora yangpuensis TaxID=683228 RepID=A0A1C6URA9_9ACTN|nr:biotin/lipoyl-containing protein [Micromonospora yangpuensis]GGM07006.1 hypothetical protein GCM10012279_26210 [Micromonospora yangpuensis]SCL56602.1 acetyl-CoA carboxylase biotin carboxyl carrier protein [Micromonospora yangpuensis]